MAARSGRKKQVWQVKPFMRKPGVSTGPPESDDGEPSVSTGLPDRLKLHFGNLDAQYLSYALGRIEEDIGDKHGVDEELQERRRRLIMTLPTREGWRVMKCLLQAGTNYDSLKDLHDRTEKLVATRWECLKAGIAGGPVPFQGAHNHIL